jgi:hypothetical protein
MDIPKLEQRPNKLTCDVRSIIIITIIVVVISSLLSTEHQGFFLVNKVAET